MHHDEVVNIEGTKICPSVSFAGAKEGLDQLREKVLKQGGRGTKLRFICEPTSMSWFPLAVYARRHGDEIIRVKAHKSHALRRYYSRHSKSDKLDPRALAMMPVVDGGSVEELYLPDRMTNALDRRCRQREKISKEIAFLKTRIKSLYQWLMPGLSDCFEDAYGHRAKLFYKRYTNPFRIKSLGISGLGKVLDKVGRQHPAEGLAKRIYEATLRACEMYDHADGYIDFDELQKEVDCELNLLESYEKVQKKLIKT